MATPAAAEVRDLEPLETSPQDDRSYRAIELANGLQVRAWVWWNELG